MKISKRKAEDGSLMVDELGSLVVFVFMIIMVLVFAGYSKSIQMRLSIDNIAKTYLYQMEQDGYLSSTNEANMISDLTTKIGAISVNTNGTTKTQVGYGQKILLSVEIKFPNPLYSLFSDKAVIFFGRIVGIENQYVTYQINMPTTAKW